MTGCDWSFEPIRKGDIALATLGIAGRDGRSAVRQDEYPLLAILLDQTALALDRMALREDLRDVEDVRRRDRLRSALLSSVSHDLRTPAHRDTDGGRRIAQTPPNRRWSI